MWNSRWSVAVAAAFVSLLASQISAADPPAIRYVKPGGVNTPFGGTSWSNAWETLDYALERLNTSDPSSFDEIRLERGGTGFTYTPGSTAGATFSVEGAVVIRGGYDSALHTRSEGDRSTLSGNLGGELRSAHIMTLAGGIHAITLEGLRFADGDARGGASYLGGAILTLQYAMPKNSGTHYSGPLELVDCAFANNKAYLQGGAIFLDLWRAKMSKCLFENNEVYGISQPLGTYGPASGGAIYSSVSVLNVKLSTFSGNEVVGSKASEAGGGAIATGPASDGGLRCVNCSFVGNSCRTTGSYGGAVAGSGGAVFAPICEDADNGPTFQPIFTNCVFRGNTAGLSGGGLCCPAGAVVSSCTFADNLVTDGAGGGLFVGLSEEESETSVTNSILWGNVAEAAIASPDHQFAAIGSVVVLNFHYSCVADLDTGNYADHNIVANPSFADGALRLRYCSPARQTGSKAALPDDVLDVNGDTYVIQDHPWDLDGSARVKDNDLLDMGAFEHDAETCAADLNADEVVDGGDLGLLLGNWGACPVCLADLNCDDVVDGGDLGALLGQWNCGLPARTFGEGSSSSLTDLMAYLGVETNEQLVEALTELSFGDMTDLLSSFLGT